MKPELFNAIKVGDVVKQRPNSTYWGYNEKCNPKDMLGEVTRTTKMGDIYVDWANGMSNIYAEYDLDLQQSLPPIPGGCTCESMKLMRSGCSCEGGMAELERERK